ncbi:hypothetical protein [Pareuzebyella sediminis]|uniref:hypothetical protein n=1 Tax=Pareuzebyella sediminis TaxID=2607998 RepID=UPI0011ED3067|nr:hypothetical protein [Pareuzebyella sediminis]
MKITKDKLKIYKKYSGNIDSWARSGKRKEHELMSDDDWHLIGELIQELELIEKGLVSEDYKDRILSKFNAACPDEATKQALKSLVGTY